MAWAAATTDEPLGGELLPKGATVVDAQKTAIAAAKRLTHSRDKTVMLATSDLLFRRVIDNVTRRDPQLSLDRTPIEQMWQLPQAQAARRLANEHLQCATPALLAATDGSHGRHTRTIGWGYFTESGLYRLGATANQSIEYAEVHAIFELLSDVDRRQRVTVLIDSRTAIRIVSNAMQEIATNKHAFEQWSRSRSIIRRDAIAIAHIVSSRSNVEFVWVRGHAGNILNDGADRLAVTARRAEEGEIALEIRDQIAANIAVDVMSRLPSRANHVAEEAWIIDEMAIRAVIKQHGATRNQAIAELKAMADDFTRDADSMPSAKNNAIVIHRRGYVLKISKDGKTILGYWTNHLERTWTQVTAGVPSRFAKKYKHKSVKAPRTHFRQTGPSWNEHVFCLLPSLFLQQIQPERVQLSAQSRNEFARIRNLNNVTDDVLDSELRRALGAASTGRILAKSNDCVCVESDGLLLTIRNDGLVLKFLDRRDGVEAPEKRFNLEPEAAVRIINPLTIYVPSHLLTRYASMRKISETDISEVLHAMRNELALVRETPVAGTSPQGLPQVDLNGLRWTIRKDAGSIHRIVPLA